MNLSSCLCIPCFVSPYVRPGLVQVLHQVGARGLWGLVAGGPEQRAENRVVGDLSCGCCMTLKRPVASLTLRFLLCPVWWLAPISGSYPGIPCLSRLEKWHPFRALGSSCGDVTAAGPGWGPGCSAESLGPHRLESLP